MKIEVYEPKYTPEPVIRLALKNLPCGGVRLSVVSNDGQEVIYGALLDIMPNGILRHTYVSPDLGFALDGGRRLQLISE